MAHKRLNRILRLINAAIALLLVLLLAVIYWYAYRPLPQTGGEVRAFLSAGATAARDALGVPHIRAASEEDALFVQGYVTAQDRLFQMDGLRRSTAGTLAEIAGPGALASDEQARRLRLRRIAEEAYLTMPPRDRAVLAAYTRGVNAFISTHRGRFPLEFTLLGYDPQPWSVVDSILVGLRMFRTLTTTWRSELIKRGMLSRGDPAKVNLLFEDRAGSEVQPGSNAWVLGGGRTASGRPILSNDMHLEWSLPGIWYIVHLQAPGLDVAGVSLPGVPGVIVGHNTRIAWGVTNLQFDVQDLYIEKFDERTGRYLYDGRLEQARLEREIIPVKGRAPVELPVWVTRHGPLFVTEGSDRMALRWTAAENTFQFPFLDIDKARNWQEFTAAVSRFVGPGQNFVYADVDGNIGYHASGRLPVRKGFSGDLPLDGSSSRYEWDGYIPFEKLPSAYNPPDGLIVTANQNPFPAGYPYAVHGNFAPPFRANRIRQLLGSRKGWSAGDLLSVQTDIYSGFSHDLARQLVAAFDKRKPAGEGLAETAGVLRAWDGRMDRDQAAPLVAALAYDYVLKSVAESASPGGGPSYDYPIAPAAIATLLHDRPPGWFADWDAMLAQALADAVDECRRMQGRNPQAWRYGNYLRLLIANPVVHQVPVLGSRYDIGPVPMSGSYTTVKQTTRELGPSMRMNADLAGWDRSLLNIATGQSGQVLSSHYKDQWQHYYEGASYPMQFQKVEAKSVLRFEPLRE